MNKTVEKVESMQRARNRGPLVVRLGLAFFGIFLGVVAAEIALRVLTTKDAAGQESIGRTLLVPVAFPGAEESRAIWEADATYMVPDAHLGWSLRPNGRDKKLGLYATNALGLRSLPRETELEPLPGVVRILAVGDSFTHCDQVKYEDSWTHLLEQGLGSGCEVLNGGVPGYGTDQALLRWRELAPRLKPHLGIFGILLEDAHRNVNIIRTLEYVSTSFPFSKPRFVLAGDGLRLVNSPVIPAGEIPAVLRQFRQHELRAYEHWYLPERFEPRWYDVSRLGRYVRSRLLDRQATALRRQVLAPGSEALRLTARTARAFVDGARAAGIVPLVVVIPSIKDLLSLQAGGRPWDALRAELVSAGVEAVVEIPEPLLRGLGAGDPRSYYVGGDGHLSAAGNSAVARILQPEVEKLRPR